MKVAFGSERFVAKLACVLGVLVAPACAEDEGGGSDTAPETQGDGSADGSTGGPTSDDASDSSDGSDSSSDATATDTTGSGNCPSPGEIATYPLAGAEEVAMAAAGDLDGDGRMDIVVALASGGLRSYYGSSCGVPESGEAMDGTAAFTGLAVANLDEAGGVDVLAFDADRQLHALDGSGFEALWTGTVDNLTSAGFVMAVNMDLDGDDDVMAADQAGQTLSYIENTGSGWAIQNIVAPGVAFGPGEAGDLSGDGRDEVVFTGQAPGLWEARAISDFNYAEILILDFPPHSAVALGDFDDNQTRDLMTGTPSSVSFWVSDGVNGPTPGGSLPVASAVLSIASFDQGLDGQMEAVALHDGGMLQTYRVAGTAPEAVALTDADSSAQWVFGGDVDGDGNDDVVAIGTNGDAYVWTDAGS